MTAVYMTSDPDIYDENIGVMHPTLGTANEMASARRKVGHTTKIDKITLKRLGVKELMCAAYNGDVDVFAEEIEEVRVLKGIKSAKPNEPEPQQAGQADDTASE